MICPLTVAIGSFHVLVQPPEIVIRHGQVPKRISFCRLYGLLGGKHRRGRINRSEFAKWRASPHNSGYLKIVEIINEEVPWIRVDHQMEVLGVRANVKGMTINPNGWLLDVESAYKVK